MTLTLQGETQMGNCPFVPIAVDLGTPKGIRLGIRLSCLFSVVGDSKLGDRFGNGVRLGSQRRKQLHIWRRNFLPGSPQPSQRPTSAPTDTTRRWLESVMTVLSGSMSVMVM